LSRHRDDSDRNITVEKSFVDYSSESGTDGDYADEESFIDSDNDIVLNKEKFDKIVSVERDDKSESKPNDKADRRDRKSSEKDDKKTSRDSIYEYETEPSVDDEVYDCETEQSGNDESDNEDDESYDDGSFVSDFGDSNLEQSFIKEIGSDDELSDTDAERSPDRRKKANNNNDDIVKKLIPEFDELGMSPNN